MRFSKITYDQEGPPSTHSEIWLEEKDDSYEINWTEYAKGVSCKSNDSFELPDESYKVDEPEDIEKPVETEPQGLRIVNPGIGTQFDKKEVKNPLTLEDRVYQGFPGEIQAAHLYNQEPEFFESEDIDLHDFVEWYQQADTSLKQGMLMAGYQVDEIFGMEDSGAMDSLNGYIERHQLDGATFRVGEDEVIGEISTEGRFNSILRQVNAVSVNGILTKNPETIVEQVE